MAQDGGNPQGVPSIIRILQASDHGLPGLNFLLYQSDLGKSCLRAGRVDDLRHGRMDPGLFVESRSSELAVDGNLALLKAPTASTFRLDGLSLDLAANGFDISGRIYPIRFRLAHGPAIAKGLPRIRDRGSKCFLFLVAIT